MWGCSGKSYIERKVIQTHVWTVISMCGVCFHRWMIDSVFADRLMKQSEVLTYLCVSNSTGGAGEGHPHRETSRPPWPPFCCGTAAVPAHHSGICSTASSSPAGLNVLLCCRCHLKWIQMPSLSITLTHECRLRFVQMCSN